MLNALGQDAIMGIISHIVFIVITWKVLLAVNFDGWIQRGKVLEARLLLIFLTITIGTSVSNFILQLFNWFGQLTYFM